MFDPVSYSLLLLSPLLLQLVGVVFASAVDPYISKRHKRVLWLIVAVVFCLIVQNYFDWFVYWDKISQYGSIVLGIIGYSLRPVVIVLFFYLISDDIKIYRIGWILVGANALLYLTALFSDVTFSIDGQMAFHRGPLGFTCHIVSAVLLVGCIVLTIKEYRHISKRDMFIPIFNALLVVVGVIADSFVDVAEPVVTFLTIAIVSSTVFFYIWLHLQFVRKHEKALQAEQRIQIMMSQIQPHFLYNTLSTIQALCRIDPEKAFVITEKFGAYLRSNIDFLSSPNLIPLRKELEHTRIYAEIEMTRFPNISVTYDVEEEDFPIPALTIQPLVENAIRHGVRVCQKGKVSVRVYREGDFRMIVISDNGKGFDINQVQDSGKAHIGIQNVRERIEKMCGGRMEIESVIGEGTTIRLILPAPQKTDSVGE